jgi:hypothetical protein
MGRPLKIQKYSTNSGINSPGAAVGIDQGYTPFAAPTAMDLSTVVLPSPLTTPLPFTGVVGGIDSAGVSTTYPIISVTCNITNSFSGSVAGAIIRQKGSRKFLVATTAAIDPANAVVGVAIQIATLGDTNWQAMGAPVGATVGTLFTTTAAAAGGTTGTAFEVGQCVLANDATPGAGEMNIAMAVAGDSTNVYVSKITNRFVQDFNGGGTGGNANTGDVWAYTETVDNIDYAANFFTDESTFGKSGADVATWVGTQQNANGTLGLAQVDSTT